MTWKDLCAKVFSTYTAPIPFQNKLDEGTPENGTMHYDHVNRMVVILCNHQRAAPKTQDQSMAKMKERASRDHHMFYIWTVTCSNRHRRRQVQEAENYAEDGSSLDEDAVAEHEVQCKGREIKKAEKKFAKENEKLLEEGGPAQDKDVLRSRLSAIGDELARLEKERRTGKATPKRDKPSEKLVEAIDRLEMIRAFKLQMVDREAGEVALGTSETNYLDPR